MNLVLDADQVKAVTHLLSGKRRALFMGMGKGKTAATLSAVTQIVCDSCGGALVIAPLNVCLLTWPAELELWDQFRWLRVANLRTKEGMLAWFTKSADVYLINWEALPKFIDKVLVHLKKGDELPVNTVVYDELSKAKSHSSKRVNQWRRFTYLFEHHIGLTGTPNPNSYLDLFAQFRLLCGQKSPLGTSFIKFRLEYFEAEDYMQYKWKLRPGAKERIEAAIAPYVLSLGAGEFPMEVVDVDVPLPPDTMKFYRKLEKDLLAEINGKHIEALNAAVLVQKLIQATSGQVYNMEKEIVHTHSEKIKALKTLRKKHPGEPLLVVTMFKHERQRVLNAFPDAELFDQRDLGRWNAGEIPMWVIDPRSAGHGLNLQGPSHIVIWVSLTYSREQWDQTNARLARKGQKNLVTVYRLLCPDTIDWAVAAVLETKGAQQNGLFAALANINRLHSK